MISTNASIPNLVKEITNNLYRKRRGCVRTRAASDTVPSSGVFRCNTCSVDTGLYIKAREYVCAYGLSTLMMCTVCM